MKAELDEKGTLCISAESPVESFALTHWHEMWRKKQTLLLVSTVERDEGGVHLNNGYAEVKHQPAPRRDRSDPEGGIPGRRL